MKTYKLLYGYYKKITIDNKEKEVFHPMETLVNQGTKQLCSYVMGLKKQSGSYSQYKFKTISVNGLIYNNKFKY